MKSIDAISAVLVVAGALNWLLVGVARFDLVAFVFGMQFGQVSALSAVVYTLVGLAGIYLAAAGKGMPARWAERRAKAAGYRG